MAKSRKSFFTNKHADALYHLSKSLPRDQAEICIEAANEISRIEATAAKELKEMVQLEHSQWMRFNEQMRRADILEVLLNKLRVTRG